MRRNPLFLLATITELLRFLALAFVADVVTGGGEWLGDSALLRYASAPALLFPAAFFFLWLDSGRYAPFRPLLLAGKLVSLAAALPFGLILLSSLVPSLEGRDLRPALPWAAAILAADFFSVAAAFFGGRAVPAAAIPDDGPSSQPPLGPRGPEDIEGVEV